MKSNRNKSKERNYSFVRIRNNTTRYGSAQNGTAQHNTTQHSSYNSTKHVATSLLYTGAGDIMLCVAFEAHIRNVCYSYFTSHTVAHIDVECACDECEHNICLCELFNLQQNAKHGYSKSLHGRKIRPKDTTRWINVVLCLAFCVWHNDSGPIITSESHWTLSTDGIHFCEITVSTFARISNNGRKTKSYQKKNSIFNFSSNNLLLLATSIIYHVRRPTYRTYRHYRC